MKTKLGIIICLLALAACTQNKETNYELKKAESGGFTYEYVDGDPLKTRIYTLSNGLKVYLSDYKNEPRIQTAIAVKAGGKNDPADNTGLAHYLEHMMFKGTATFGTQDWETESVLVDSVEALFNQYKEISDPDERKKHYSIIDQVSIEASKYAIANEYDKMVSGIGAKGTNAYTTNDRTVYINDIPANQLENWLKIESNRFQMIVNRLFHTELEAVYEEKNRSLDSDIWKGFEAMLSALFKEHPYGTQTVIGTIDHLKNPSITEIKNYFYKYYVPNNVGICLSGDLDFDATIALIDKYFGSWKANETLPTWKPVQEAPLTAPIVTEVLGPDAERIMMGFRLPGRSSKDYIMVRLIDNILSNSQAGLVDLDLVKQQKVLEASTFVYDMNDYSMQVLMASPKDGQTLDQLRDLFLEELEKIKTGNFDDWLISAVVNDLKKNQLNQYQYNWARSNDLVVAFTGNMPWGDFVSEFDRMSKVTKEDVMAYAKANFGDNYALVYKRTGKDPNAQQVEKPEITKVELNREAKSPFHEAIINSEPPKLKPLFVDYDKDIEKLIMKNDLEVLYTRNDENDLFDLYYKANFGTNIDPKIKVAVDYLEFVGTPTHSAEEIQKELFKLGCNFSVFSSAEESYVMLAGLSENMEKAMEIFEDLLANAQPDEEALAKLKDRILKEREDQKKNKSAILFSGLMNYGLYGAQSPFTNVVSNTELMNLNSEELLGLTKNFTKTTHKVLYYGPVDSKRLVNILNTRHTLPETMLPLPEPKEFAKQEVDKPKVFWADYDMVQEEILFLTKGEEFDVQLMPETELYNEYFGGNMGSIVFQEIREAQGLAYSVWANYSTADEQGKSDHFFAYIGTQADKQNQAVPALLNIIENLPASENGLATAKKSIMSQIESERITRGSKLFNYESARDMGLDHDIRQDIYEKIPTMTMEDVVAFQKQYVKGKKYNMMVLGDKDKIDFKGLQQYGEVKQLTLEELFGYDKVEKINIQ
ncbi:MAG: insulinase family protein [Imperialibacter sp.]|uniref:M16 family metallopeptidase n=1 Tax=Imperialibacter sp. TaxID=2038411 RepID=UPI0032EB4F16